MEQEWLAGRWGITLDVPLSSSWQKLLLKERFLYLFSALAQLNERRSNVRV